MSKGVFEDMFGDMFGNKNQTTKANVSHEKVGKKFIDDKGIHYISTGHIEGSLHRCYCVHDKKTEEVYKHVTHWMTE